MSCIVGRPLRPVSWLAVPVLFGTAVLGLTGLGAVLLGDPRPITLPSALFGASAAMGFVTAPLVSWRRYRPPRWAYPAAFLVVGVFADGVQVPVGLSCLIGLPAVAFLVHRYFVERRLTAESAHQSGWS
ncbi:hypothetical protein GCM10022243_50890 [Saccharothrix violaceirubra]|uniref:Uncharacterized protein n=1 Tax=Saccharothrix violaceirubra TaxID=413306 RepID=A0A7W7SZ62_9PSEU|nr:hypothetical protein [Saccharothrix violaceirubra]MBB4963569.1 hypothetical protein [Saccharothrix violaceirubra]